MLTIEQIRETVASIAPEYNLKKVTLFGSRANGTARADSDVDLIVEFSKSITVSLFTIAALKIRLEEIFGLGVDIIHAPIPETSILIIDKEVSIYAA